MKKSLAIIILLFIATAFIHCDKNKEADPKQTMEGNKPFYNFENPPKFRKDGELFFLNSENNKKLFKIDIEIARNDDEKALGLMYRPEMDKNHGMLFLFEKDEIRTFYMHNTLISLDIIYINSNMEIVDIYKNTEILSEKYLTSKATTRYIVEINAGLCEEYEIREGDRIIF